jgi:HKD family nuclease
MIVRVYFYKETNPEIMFGSSKFSRQALSTIYELVWEVEFKNILSPGIVSDVGVKKITMID